MSSVLFVCMGNICRSPTAHGVFRHFVAARGLADRIHIDSAGTHGFHPGKAPDPRSQRAAARRGYDLTGLRAREIEERDFHTFDYVLAMDRSNYLNLFHRCPPGREERLRMYLSFVPHLDVEEVPDPYFGEGDGFEVVLDLVEAASAALLEHLVERLER